MLSVLMVLGSIVGIVSEVQAHVHGDSAFRNPNGGAPQYGMFSSSQDEGDVGESIFSSDPLRLSALIAIAVVVLGAVVFLYKRDIKNK